MNDSRTVIIEKYNSEDIHRNTFNYIMVEIQHMIDFAVAGDKNRVFIFEGWLTKPVVKILKENGYNIFCQSRAFGSPSPKSYYIQWKKHA